MPAFTDKEIKKIIEQAEEKLSIDPIDDPDNPNVPKGGRWGVTGMSQTPEMFRQRVGSPGLNVSPGGKIKPKEVEKLVQRINQVQPDEIIAYSRGAALYNWAKSQGAGKDAPVTFMAPSSYRNWGGGPVSSAAPGSKVTIGDEDALVPMKQAAKNAIAANAPMYVLPGFSHVGIMYSKGDVTPGGFEVDPEEIVQDPEMPDWGSSGTAEGGKNGPEITKQKEQVKQHVKERRMVSELVKLLLAK